MYTIKIGEITHTVARPVWRREYTRGKHSMIISSLERNAQGVWLDGVDYHVEGLPEFKHHDLETVTVERVVPDVPEIPPEPVSGVDVLDELRVELSELRAQVDGMAGAVQELANVAAMRG